METVRADTWNTAGSSSPAILYILGIIRRSPCDAVKVVVSIAPKVVAVELYSTSSLFVVRVPPNEHPVTEDPAKDAPDVLPSAEDVDRAMWHILTGIEPYKISLLKRLAENYDLYMLSNNNAICLPRSRQLFAEAGATLEELFRKCYFSFEMKALKPSEEFYKAVMEDIGGSAEDMLFIDDSQKNVDGSIRAGLPAVYYEPGTDLEALLDKVLEGWN